MPALIKCKIEGCGFDALNDKDLRDHMEEMHKIKQEDKTVEQGIINKDKEIDDFKSLWEERTTLIIDLIEKIKDGSTTDDIITDLKENSEDIAKTIFMVFKKDSESKNKDHEEYYYELTKKSHPTRGSALNPEEDTWMRNYMSVSMFTRILKDNITLLNDYFRCLKENDIKGQTIIEEGLGNSINSTTGFLKSMSNTWDIDAINRQLTKYLRNINKMSIVLLPNNKNNDIQAELIEDQLNIAREIAQILLIGVPLSVNHPHLKCVGMSREGYG